MRAPLRPVLGMVALGGLLTPIWSAGKSAVPSAPQPSKRAEPVATPAPPPIPEGKARVVYLHLASDAKDKPLSTWHSATVEPEVSELAYGRFGFSDVPSGSQGFCARFAGMEPPTKLKLGWNTGLGNLPADSLSFVVAYRSDVEKGMVTTRSERAISIEPPADKSALRMMGIWPGPWTISVCESGPAEETALIPSMAGAAALGYGPQGAVHLRAATDATLNFYRPTSPQERCGGLALGKVKLTTPTGSKNTVFVFGSAEAPGLLRVIHCNESPLLCKELKLEP